jgi:hypothetical protein
MAVLDVRMYLEAMPAVDARLYALHNTLWIGLLPSAALRTHNKECHGIEICFSVYKLCGNMSSGEASGLNAAALLSSADSLFLT